MRCRAQKGRPTCVVSQKVKRTGLSLTRPTLALPRSAKIARSSYLLARRSRGAFSTDPAAGQPAATTTKTTHTPGRIGSLVSPAAMFLIYTAF